MMTTYNELCGRVKAGDMYALAELIDRLDLFIQKNADYMLVRYKNISLCDTDDLVQCAKIEVYKACLKYMPDKTDSSFRAYVSICIQGRMFSEVKNFTRYVRLPVNKLDCYEKLSSTLEGLSIAEQMDFVKKEFHLNDLGAKDFLTNYHRWWGDFQRDITNIDVSEYDAFQSEETFPEAIHDATIWNLKTDMNAVLSKLTQREEKILRLRYGIDDDIERTLEQVGTMFCVTGNRIRQIEAKALRKLRHPSRAMQLREYYD